MAFNPQTTINRVDALVKATKGLICLGITAVSFLNPRNLLAGVGMLAVGIANSVANAVTGQIADHIQDVLGIVSVPFLMLRAYTKSLQRSVKNLKRAYKNITQKAKDIVDYLTNTQNCAVQGANFMNCIFKSLMNKIDKKVTNKLISNIDDTFDKLKKDISGEVLRGGGILDQHVGRQVRQFESLTKKLNILA
jgi:hypothetical protein